MLVFPNYAKTYATTIVKGLGRTMLLPTELTAGCWYSDNDQEPMKFSILRKLTEKKWFWETFNYKQLR